MTISTGAMTPLPSAAEDRRRHPRAPLALLGRYRLATHQDYPCLSVDVSLGGLSLLAPVKAPVGQSVGVYLEQLGRLDGTIVRHTMYGMALSLRTTAREREQLAARLHWLVHRHAQGLAEARRHVRIVPFHTAVVVALPDGSAVTTRLIDLSRSGAALYLDPQPPVGTTITIGETPGRVVRHCPGGVAVEFLQAIPRNRFSESVVL